MTARRWRQVKELLDQALDLGSDEQRDFLAEVRREDPDVAAEVEVLLALETEAGDFIEEPAFDIHDRDDPAVRVGQRLGPYELVQEVGSGGMGTVFLAVRADKEYDKTVAVKVLKRGLDTEEIVHRFRNERQILAGLEHPNIARLLDGGTTPDGRPYLVMDHVEGQPIDVYCHQRELDVDARLELFLTVCSAVQLAHRNLVVHRDLKPSNILVSDDGVPKLLDFGIARLLTPERAYTLPTAGAWRFLTPEYASPEQLTGAPITTATDVYSLGVLLYALLTDRRPYHSEERSAAALARVLEHAEPPKPSTVAPPERARRLRGDLDNIVLTALRREPERRYGSVEALADDLRRHLDGLPVRATPDSLPYRIGKFVRRHRVGVTAAAAIAVLLVSFGVVTSVLLDRAVEARELAEQQRRVAEQEQQKAEAVSDFLVELFEAPDPRQGHEPDLLAREILDEGSKQLIEGGELEDEPEVRAALLYTLAKTYLELGLYGRAEELLAQSTDLQEAQFGPNSDELVLNLALEAQIAEETGQGKKAEPLLVRAIEIARRHRKPGDSALLTLRNNLASIYSRRGMTELAEEINRDVLEKRLHEFGEDHHDVATSLNNLADNLRSLGRPQEAEPMYRRALEIRRSVEEPSEREVASTLNGLASVLEETGRYDEAESHYREALVLQREYFEERHPRMASALSNLGGLLVKTGKLEEAEKAYLEALEILGEDHQNRGRILTHFATLRVHQSRPEEAEIIAREAIAALDGKEITPWWSADAKGVLGAALAAQGRFTDAEPLLLDSYQ